MKESFKDGLHTCSICLDQLVEETRANGIFFGLIAEDDITDINNSLIIEPSFCAS